MSRAGEFTLALTAVSLAMLHEVRTLEAHAPRPTIVVSMEDVLFTPAPLQDVAAMGVAPLAPIEIPVSSTQFEGALTFAPPPRLAWPPPIFVDRFQSLNEAERWAISDGWSNGAWTANDWRRQQLHVGDGGLSITLAASTDRDADKPFASGEISTHQMFRRGYFEARFRMPRGSGLVAGVFTFARPSGPESWNEIDMEILGRDTRRLELTIYSAGQERKHIVALPFDAAEDFHTYAFDWRADSIRWYVDGQLVHEARGADVEAMDQPQRFIVNLWNSEQLGAWVGPIDTGAQSWTLSLACVAHAETYPGRSICTPS